MSRKLPRKEKLPQKGVIDKDDFLALMKKNHLSELVMFGRNISKNNNIKIEHLNTVQFYLMLSEKLKFAGGSRKNYTEELREIALSCYSSKHGKVISPT